MPIANCDLSPVARQIILHQFDDVKRRLKLLDRPNYASLVEIVTDSVAKCFLG